MHRLTPFLFALLLACAPEALPESEPGEEPETVATAAAAGATPEPTPTTPDPGQLCTLEVDSGDGWEKRSGLGCPSDGTMRIVAVGDVGFPGRVLDDTTDGLLRACHEAGGCQALVIPGDLVYGPGNNADMVWTGVWDDALSRLGVYGFAVLGNHEYRHEPNPELKRKVVFAADKRAGLVLPKANYAARILGPDGDVRLAIAALDTDTIVRKEPLDPLHAALATACSTGAPVITVGHHPASSQGQHTTHERPVEAGVRGVLKVAPEGCKIVGAFAGHDHDLQVWPPGCEEIGTPAVIVSGVAARGFRPPGDKHLSPCPVSDDKGAYFAGPRQDGGFALMVVKPDGSVAVSLFDTTKSTPLTTLEF